MRKELYFCRLLPFAAIVMLACGCSDTSSAEGGAEQDDAMRMRFGTARVDTRAVVGTAELQVAGSAFSVWGTYRNGTSDPVTVFDGTRVTSDGAKWTYDVPQYWFPTFTYDFRALYPADLPAGVSVRFASDEARLSVENFDALSGIDLLAASPAAVTCVPGKTMGPVNLDFRHLLSRVTFVGRSDEQHLGTGRRVVIDRAVLYGIRTTGSWSGASFTGTASGAWTPTGPVLGADADLYSAASVELAVDGTKLFPDDRTLFIPQDLSEAVLEVTFHYNYTDADSPLQFTSRVALSTVSERWEAGKSYRYPFSIESHIFFETPTVEPWQYAPVNGPDFNVDL